MPITREWAGQKIWEPAYLPVVKVGKFGCAAAVIKDLCLDRKPIKWAEVSIPAGGLNQWTADELRKFAAVLNACADDLDTHPSPYRETTP